MWSTLKKLTSKNDGQVPAPPKGLQAMPTALQRKFAKGVQYNMKIILKGDRNVGKTCLFERLQGHKFLEEYIPTEGIQVTSIHWNYKTTDDVVKVEVWDVVDKGKKKKIIDGLKIDNINNELPEEPALDAEFLDVYKGTNGVILIMDMTKTWTYDYIKRELPKVPLHIPVLILANHCDMSHHRAVTEDTVRYFIQEVNRPEDAAQIRYAESSMRNGFGLKLIHKFFNLPFLQLQRESLLQQLQTNVEETKLTNEELDWYQNSDAYNYDKFLEHLTNVRRQNAEALSHFPSNDVPNSHVQNSHTPSGDRGKVGPGVSTLVKSTSSPSELMKNSNRNATARGQGEIIKPALQCEEIKEIVKVSSASKTPIADHKERTGFMSKFLNRNATANMNGSVNQVIKNVPSDPPAPLKTSSASTAPPTTVDDFVPDEGVIDSSFLEDVKSSAVEDMEKAEESDDEQVGAANPMVADFQDELDPDDLQSMSGICDLSCPAKIVSDSEDEDPNDIIVSVSQNFDDVLCVSHKFEDIEPDSLSSLQTNDSSIPPNLDIDLNQSVINKFPHLNQSDSIVNALTVSAAKLTPLDVDFLENISSSKSQPVDYEVFDDGESSEKHSKKKKKVKDEKVKKHKSKKSKEVIEGKSDKIKKVKKKKVKDDSGEGVYDDDLESFLNGDQATPNNPASYETM